MPMAVLMDLQGKSDIKDIKQVTNYLYQLEDQIRYVLANIGSENLSAGAVDVSNLAPALKQNIQNIEIRMEREERKSRQLVSEDGKLRTLIVETEAGIMREMEDVESGLRTTITETASGLRADIQTNAGDITSLQATAQGLGARITNAEGNITTLTATASGLQTRVSSAEGDISSLTQTAQGLQSRVSSAEGNISALTQTASGISARVTAIETDGTGKVNNTAVLIDGSGVDIKSTGRLKVNMTNFKIDSSGNVTVTGEINANSGSIGKFDILNNGLGSLTREVTLIQDEIGVGPVGNRGFRATGSGAFIKALYLYDSGTGSYSDVTAAVLALL